MSVSVPIEFLYDTALGDAQELLYNTLVGVSVTVELDWDVLGGLVRIASVLPYDVAGSVRRADVMPYGVAWTPSWTPPFGRRSEVKAVP